MTSTAPQSQGLTGLNITRWGSGQPTVMIHGGGQGDPSGGAVKWQYQKPLADQGWELIVPDRPGSGQSPSRGPEDFERCGQWVAELLGDGGHLVGHSYGGAISLVAAGLRPEAVHSLTLIEPPVFSIVMDNPDASEMALKVKKAAEARIPLLGMVSAFKVLGIPRGLTPRPKVADIRNMGKGFRTMRHPYEWASEPVIERVAQAGIPTFYVDGGWSPALGANLDELARRTGGRRLSIHAGHHFPQMADGGAEFNAAWHQFASPITETR